MDSPSLVVFTPQLSWPSPQCFSLLRETLLNEPSLQGFRDALKSLPSLWENLDTRLKTATSKKSIDSITLWLDNGNFPEDFTARPPSILFMPVMVVIHLVQYLHCIGKSGAVSHAQVLESTKKYEGIFGYSTGLLAAYVIAGSKDEQDISQIGGAALRLAVVIGAYIDCDVEGDSPDTCYFEVVLGGNLTTYHVLEMVKEHPEACISAITSYNSLKLRTSLAASAPISRALISMGCAVKPIYKEYLSKLSSPENLALKISEACKGYLGLQFPNADELLVPVRSITDREAITSSHLQSVLIDDILVENNRRVGAVPKEICVQTQIPHTSILQIGEIDCFPASRELDNKVRITKLGSLKLFSQASSTGCLQPKTAISDSILKTLKNDGCHEHAFAVIGMAYRFLANSPNKDHPFGEPASEILVQVAVDAMGSSSYIAPTSIPNCHGKNNQTGCYIGIGSADIGDINIKNTSTDNGTLRGFRAKNISRFFGWKGPSITFDAKGCSSAMSIEASCRAMENGECLQALAGGTSLLETPIFYQNDIAVSFSSLSKVLNTYASPPENSSQEQGVGLVVLKKLSDAIDEGCTIIGIYTNPSSNKIQGYTSTSRNGTSHIFGSQRLSNKDSFNTMDTSKSTALLAADELTTHITPQEAFEKVKYDYDIYTKQTGFVDFWKGAYLDQTRLVLAYVVEAFAALECPIGTLKYGQRLPAIHTLPRHEKVMAQYRGILESQQLVMIEGTDLIRTKKPVENTLAFSIFQEIIPKFPQHATEFKLLQVTGSDLADCLTGAKDPLNLLFGNTETIELLTEFYTNAPMFDAITRLLGSFLAEAFSNAPNHEGGTYNILEIGGGTGGTTKHVVEILERTRIPFTYTFTDISPSLVALTKKKFAGHNNMIFTTLDIERLPPANLRGQFHAVISSNCVHATKNLITTTTNIKETLRPEGFLALVELTRNIPWLDLVFGLLEGWWLFEDGREHALASEWQWDVALRSAGFGHVSWSDGTSQESQGMRLIVGFLAEAEALSFLPRKT